MKKQYQHDQVIYGFVPKYRKWSFTSGAYTLITQCPNGIETAQRIARLINSAVQRVGKVDVLARNNINKLVYG